MKTVENIEVKNEKKGKFKRQVIVVGGIVKQGVKEQLTHKHMYSFAAGIGVAKGLQGQMDLKRGVKAGLTSVAVMTCTNVVMNIVDNIETIKNA